MERFEDVSWITKHIEKKFSCETIALAVEIYDACKIEPDASPHLHCVACISIASKFEECDSIKLSSWLPIEDCKEGMRYEMKILSEIDFSLLTLSNKHALSKLSLICLSYDRCFEIARKLLVASMPFDFYRQFDPSILAWSALQISRHNEKKYDHPCVKSMRNVLRSVRRYPCVS